MDNYNKPNKACAICGKGYRRSFSRSHSMQSTIKRQQPNLQWLKMPVGKRVRACTQCIKSVSKGKINLANTVLVR